MFKFRDFFRKPKFAFACILVLAVASFPAAGQTPAGNAPQPSSLQIAARDEMNQGVDAYKSARYQEAIAHFQRATELNPDLPLAKRYLATALAQIVVPGLDTPENLKSAQQAIDAFQQVLAGDPHNVNSMKQIAGICSSVKKLDGAREWQKRVLDEDPQDPEAAYIIGVIDWTEAHQNVLKALTAAGFDDDGEGNTHAPAEVMKPLKAQNGALVEEALAYLTQAVENRPDYANAMAYLNLVYRRKADVDWGDEAARKDDLDKANEWRVRAMEIRRASEEKKIARPDSAQP